MSLNKPATTDANAPALKKAASNKTAIKGKSVKDRQVKEPAAATAREKADTGTPASGKAAKGKRGRKADAELKIKKGEDK